MHNKNTNEKFATVFKKKNIQEHSYIIIKNSGPAFKNEVKLNQYFMFLSLFPDESYGYHRHTATFFYYINQTIEDYPIHF